jgi:hypothetical protein
MACSVPISAGEDGSPNVSILRDLTGQPKFRPWRQAVIVICYIQRRVSIAEI